MRIHLVCSGGIVVPARLKTVNTMLDGLDRKDRKQSSANKKESSIKQHLAFDVPADVDRSMLDDSTDDGSRRERIHRNRGAADLSCPRRTEPEQRGSIISAPPAHKRCVPSLSIHQDS